MSTPVAGPDVEASGAGVSVTTTPGSRSTPVNGSGSPSTTSPSSPLGSLLSGNLLFTLPGLDVPILGGLLGKVPTSQIPEVSRLLASLPTGSLPIIGQLLGAVPSGNVGAVENLLGTLPAGGVPVVGDLLATAPSGNLPVAGQVLGAGPTGNLPLLGNVVGDLPAATVTDVLDLSGLSGVPRGSSLGDAHVRRRRGSGETSGRPEWESATSGRRHPADTSGVPGKGARMGLVVLLLLLALIFGGVGLFVEGLTWVLIIALVLLVASALTGSRGRRGVL